MTIICDFSYQYDRQFLPSKQPVVNVSFARFTISLNLSIQTKSVKMGTGKIGKEYKPSNTAHIHTAYQTKNKKKNGTTQSTVCIERIIFIRGHFDKKKKKKKIDAFLLLPHIRSAFETERQFRLHQPPHKSQFRCVAPNRKT